MEKLGFNKAENFLLKVFEERKVPGASVAFVSGEDIIWSKGFGYSNLEEKTQTTPETVFRVASVSKPVIATALLQWMDRGMFHLDDSVKGLMEEVQIRTEYEQPTVRNLLTHTSGFPVHVDPTCFELSETVTLEDMINESAITVHPPNQEIVYSNTAFNIIGYLVGLFADMPYPRYLKEGLFKPLKMDSSSFEQTNRIRKMMAQPYSRKKKSGSPIEAVKPWYGGSMPEKPCGSLFTTATDLGNFMIAQINGGLYRGNRILKAETMKEMHLLQASAGNSRSGYALSWKRNWHYGNLMLSHTGGNLGWTAHFAFYPELKIGVIILCNLNDNSGWRPPARETLHLLVGGTLSFDPETTRMKETPEIWDKLKGRYDKQFQEAEISIDEENLVLRKEKEKSYLEDYGNERYILHGGGSDGMELTFEFDGEGFAKQFDLEAQMFLRFHKDTRSINKFAKLEGVWQGIYVHPYGQFKMELEIRSGTVASVTNMTGNRVSISNFKAEQGHATGNFRFKNLPRYIGWGAKEMEAELKLAVIEDVLEGRMTFKSDIGKSIVPLALSRTRNTPQTLKRG